MNHTLKLAVLGGLFAACDDPNDYVHINIDGHQIDVISGEELPVAAPASTPLQVTGFDALGTEAFVDVVADVGPQHKAWLECDPDVAKGLAVFVDDTVLVVRKTSKASISFNSGPCRLHATAPKWRAIVSLGSGDVQVSGPLPALEQVHTTGSGDVSISGVQQVPSLVVKTTGSGDITLQGSAHSLTANASGSGDLHAGNLTVHTASVRTMGSGDIEVHTTKTLTAVTRGSGDILASGPGIVTATSHGSGEVRQ